jgi:hypothetical protein
VNTGIGTWENLAIMPTESPFPSVEIPNVDLWGLMFEQPRDFADSQGGRNAGKCWTGELTEEKSFTDL